MKQILISGLILLVLSSCSTVTPTVTVTPFAEVTVTFTPIPTVTPSLAPVPTETPIPFDQMTPEQKLATAPEIEDLEKSNFSTLKSNLLIYRNADGKAEKVYDFLTKTNSTLIDAGIVEFEFNGGGNIEVLSFNSAEEAMNFIAHNTPWFTGDVNRSQALLALGWFGGTTREFYNQLFQIQGGRIMPIDLRFPRNTDTFFHAMTGSINGKTVLIYKDFEDKPHAVYINLDVSDFEIFADKFSMSMLPTPTP